MVIQFKHKKKNYPYSTGYFVFKKFQNTTGKSVANFESLTLENIAYLHYLGFVEGADEAEKECDFKEFKDFEKFLNDDFSILSKLEEVFLKFMPQEEEEQQSEGK